MTRQLRPYQVSARDAVYRSWTDYRSTLLVLATGCHDADQLVLMHDGSTKRAADVVVGDRLMGPDSMPRTVLRLVRGRDEMVTIHPTKGESWRVNLDHVLSLVRTPTRSPATYPSQGEALVDVTVREWLLWSKTAKHRHKLYRAEVDFPVGEALPIAPYVLGLLLGDGCLTAGSVTIACPDEEIDADVQAEAARLGGRVSISDNGDRCRTLRIVRQGDSGPSPMLDALRALGLAGCVAASKVVPPAYRCATREERLELLAGMLDTDGHFVGGSGFDWLSASRDLAEGFAFVARSVGLAAYITPKRVDGYEATYWRVSVSGDCSIVPTRVLRKQAAPRRLRKSVLRTGFDVQRGAVGEYFGWTVDGDHRYLLADFTVSHNCGKTFTAGEILRERANHGRILWVAHRSELLDQARDTIVESIGLTCEIEKAEARARRRADLLGYLSDVVVASVQTLGGTRLTSWDREHFATIVVDEAHHATAKTYRAILEHFHAAKVLGLTATPDRGDGVAMGHVFDDVAFQYDIRTAIREGYLCPIIQKTIQVAEIDLADVKTVAGDLNQGQLARIMESEGALHGIASPLAREIGDRSTILFTASVEQAQQLAQILDGYGVRASEVNGATPTEIRKERLARFAAGEIQVLANCAVLTEGFDMPSTACVAVARPTKSRALYTQMVGRGTRIAPGKTDCLVLDFVGNAGRHRLINPLDVLAGKPLPEDVQKRAKELAEDGAPTESALAQAEAEAIERERAREAAAARAAKVRAEAAYRAQVVDPFAIVGPAGEGAHASHAQLDYLLKLGVPEKELKKFEAASRNDVSKLIDKLQSRRREGLCSYKQARILAKHGLRTDLGFSEATQAITAISNAGWRATPEVVAMWGAP